MANQNFKLNVLILSAVTFLLGILVGKPIEHAVSEFLKQKNVTYEMIHSNYESIGNAQKYTEIEGLTPFNVSLDDPLIDQYHILKVKINNEGVSINNSLKFNLTINNMFTKIIDIKHRVITPKSKNLLITNTIPSLSWSIDILSKQRSLHSLSWQPPQQRIDGSKINITEIMEYNIFGSMVKDVGYGQINETPIKEPLWRLGDDRYPFYKTQVFDSGGRRSELSPAVPYPEVFAFTPFFEDVVQVVPNLKSDFRTRCDNCKIYNSLSQAIKEEGTQATFLINKRKSDTLNLDNVVDSSYYKNKILYSDNILNMQGKADILMPAGLDEDSEIIFFILYKIWPNTEHDVDFSIVGHPDIKFVNVGDTSTLIIPNNTKSNSNSSINNKYEKTMLTPPTVSSYIANNKIHLLWDRPKETSYQGVRIFRSIKGEGNDNKLGNEVYDGSGEIKELICMHDLLKDKMSNTTAIPVKNHITAAPPPRVKPAPINEKLSIGKNSSPRSPSILSVHSIVIINEKDGELLPYFVDTNVSPDHTYSYTLYAYNDKDNYSYPIKVNASLEGGSNIKNCP